MARGIPLLGERIKALIALEVRSIAQENTRTSFRLQLVSIVRLKIGIASATKDLENTIVRWSSKESKKRRFIVKNRTR